MSIGSNYPNGFREVLTLRGVPVLQSHPGKVYWVSNNTTNLMTGEKAGSNGNDGSFWAPWSTLDYAVGRCAAGKGDIIMIKPGHAETVSSAGAIALDVAGIAIYGLGQGASRPTFTFDTATTAAITVSANNISIQNCIFTANFADIVTVFTLTTAKYFTLERCYFKATAADKNFLHVIDTNATTADADGLYVANCKWIEPDAATLAFALVDGTNDDWYFGHNYLNLGGTTGAAMGFTVATGKVLTNTIVEDNFGRKVGQTDGSGGVWLSTDGSTNSGIFRRNYSENTDDAANTIVTATNGFSMGPDNYHSGEQNEHGVAITSAFNNA